MGRLRFFSSRKGFVLAEVLLLLSILSAIAVVVTNTSRSIRRASLLAQAQALALAIRFAEALSLSSIDVAKGFAKVEVRAIKRKFANVRYRYGLKTFSIFTFSPPFATVVGSFGHSGSVCDYTTLDSNGYPALAGHISVESPYAGVALKVVVSGVTGKTRLEVSQ